MPVSTGAPKKKKQIKSPGRRVPQLEKGRRPGPSLYTRGPRPLWGKPKQTDVPGLKPGNITITDAEWQAYWWMKYRSKLAPEQWEFQSSLEGGRMNLGGLVVDFLVHELFPEPGLVINVHGEYWHRYTTMQRATDLYNKTRLEGLGFTVVYILEDELYRNLENVMRSALKATQLYPDSV